MNNNNVLLFFFGGYKIHYPTGWKYYLVFRRLQNAIPVNNSEFRLIKCNFLSQRALSWGEAAPKLGSDGGVRLPLCNYLMT